MKTNKNYFLLFSPTQNHKGKTIKGKTILKSFCQKLFCHRFCFSGFKKLMVLSAGTLIFILTSSALPPTQAFAQEKCETALADAQSMYDAGRFAQAIVHLNLCVPDRIPPEQRINAYRLLAICYLNEDYRDEARIAIRKIFDLKRQYEPDVQDPQPYRDLAAEVKASLPKPLSQKLFGGVKKWLWLGGGAAGTYFAVRSFGKKTEEPDLPPPPELP